MRKILAFIPALFIATQAYADIAKWSIEPSKSHIRFTALQNNAPVQGEFKKFRGEIAFDPKHLNDSKVRITISLGSVSASYEEMVETLKAPDWFDISRFPEAVFESSSFKELGDRRYSALGNLTLRGKTVPIELEFTLNTFTDTDAAINGSVTLSRSAFGVGQGQWAKTDAVKDAVEVVMDIKAKRI